MDQSLAQNTALEKHEKRLQVSRKQVLVVRKDCSESKQRQQEAQKAYEMLTPEQRRSYEQKLALKTKTPILRRLAVIGLIANEFSEKAC